MRIHVFSDLHLEFGPISFTDRVRSGSIADLVLLAGDIDVGRKAVGWAAAEFQQPVVLIGGNHEAYGDSLFASIADARRKAERISANRIAPVRYLERETWVLSSRDGTPVRVIGATLWTDFALFGKGQRRVAMASAFSDMNDYSLIKIRDPMDRATRKLLPDDTYNIHLAAKSFISEELSTHFDGITIVMTHHAPSFRSVPEQWRRDNLAPCYASSLDGLIEEYQPNLWVHGHLHTSADYQIGMTRIVCNPRGYMPDGLNPGFNPELVVEIP